MRISARSYLAASRRARVPCFGKAVQTNLEGFLFPATYSFARKVTATEAVNVMVGAPRAVGAAHDLWPGDARGSCGASDATGLERLAALGRWGSTMGRTRSGSAICRVAHEAVPSRDVGPQSRRGPNESRQRR